MEEESVWLAPPECCDVSVHLALHSDRFCDPSAQNDDPSAQNRESDLAILAQNHESDLPILEQEDEHDEPSAENEESDLPMAEQEERDGEQQQQQEITTIVVHATSHTLCQIPYFSTLLNERWCNNQNSSRHVATKLSLDGISPRSFCRCLQLLRPGSPVSYSPNMFNNVTDALELLSAADHLLFKEGARVCMQYLATVPWSWEEETSIRSKVSSLGLEPLSDLKDRLDTSNDVKVFKELLSRLSSVSNSSFIGMVKTCLESSKSAIVKTTRQILVELWEASVIEFCTKAQAKNEPSRYYLRRAMDSPLERLVRLTTAVMDFTDGREVVDKFANCEVFQSAFETFLRNFTYHMDRNRLSDFICGVLEKVATGGVVLGNAGRISLYKAWVPCLQMINNNSTIPLSTRQLAAVESLISTLPLTAPEVVQLMKGACDGQMEPCYSRWLSRILTRIAENSS